MTDRRKIRGGRWRARVRWARSRGTLLWFVRRMFGPVTSWQAKELLARDA